MKTSICVLLLLLFSINQLSAQRDIVLEEDFIDNRNNWLIIDTKDATTSNPRGYYMINHKVKNGSYRFWKSIFINPEEDFTIESRLKQIAGPEDYGYGLVWASSGWDNSYSFQVSSNGYFRVYQYTHGNFRAIKNWTQSEAINGLGTYNILKVAKKGSFWIFYINDKEVFTCYKKQFLGSNSGFVVNSTSIIMVDNFKIKQNQPEINIAKGAISGTKKENIGRAINSSFSEIAPIIAPDGKTLYVAQKGSAGNKGNSDTYDIYYSKLQKDSTWSELKNIGDPLNNEGDNVVIAITPDNNTIMLEGLYNYDGSHKSDQGISIAYRTQSGWSIPQKINIKNYYNKDIYESFCPSADRKVIIMSVQRDDTYGSKDLYISFLQNDGSYSEPKNMGSILNTYDNDGTPFLAPDGKTLYYYTYGKPGYGSADIFVTKRLDDTWLTWSEPKNLGPLVNSSDWDTYFSISASGDYAYLVSTRNSFGNEDVFRIKLTEESKPDPVVLIYGNVYNKKTKRPLGADIKYEILKNGKEAGIASSNPRNGEYKIILPYGEEYGFRAEVKNFIPISENINLIKYHKYIEIKKDLYLAPIEVGETVALNNIFFKRAKAIVLEESFSELDRLVELMNEYPSMEIEIQGHTENRGSYDALVKLSVQRVETVRKYIIDKGIDEKRIKGKGFGPSKPIADNNTEEGRKMNRRVEFKILKK